MNSCRQRRSGTSIIQLAAACATRASIANIIAAVDSVVAQVMLPPNTVFAPVNTAIITVLSPLQNCAVVDDYSA